MNVNNKSFFVIKLTR